MYWLYKKKFFFLYSEFIMIHEYNNINFKFFILFSLDDI